MQKGFWGNLSFPIVGLSPMDGVTDAPWRFIAKKYGHPDVMYTEFVSAEGVWRTFKRQEMDHRIWKELKHDPSESPVVAQIFGSEPQSFYEATKIVCEMDFNGIDINMGCPSPGLERSGGGAGLIRDQCRTREVIAATRLAVKEWSKKTGKEEIPVTLKTRVGSMKPDESWWKFLATQEMPAVAMHGRTFKQLYSGEADWDVLFKAGEIIRESGALFLANGDIKKILNGGETVEVANGRQIDLKGSVDGVLVGRSATGNPWMLRKDGYEVSVKEKLMVAVEHARKYEEILIKGEGEETLGNDGRGNFFPIRKHLTWYAHGFPLSSDLRRKLVMTNTSDEVKIAVEDFLEENNLG